MLGIPSMLISKHAHFQACSFQAHAKYQDAIPSVLPHTGFWSGNVGLRGVLHIRGLAVHWHVQEVQAAQV